MEKRAGAFVVIEGADGSGKSTQFELLKRRLESEGHAVEVFKFPRYDQHSSYFVRRYLEGGYGQAEDVGPYTSSLFYALDRFEAAADIRRVLGEGKIVLCDRFSGSNMAHQGSKIPNAEQRRGFFIWLDNLEFEMLRIPRPDISFVLRVPADMSQKLRSSRRKKDVHEADPTHVERTIAVYDDMVQLFPKDFQRIDCVRGGQLLDIETVHSMLWEKVTPLLPEPRATDNPGPTAQQATSTTATEVSQTETAAEPAEPEAPAPLILENVSALLSQKIERLIPSAQLDYPDIPTFYTPATLIPAAQQTYDTQMNVLLGLYAKLVAGLAKRGISVGEARLAAQLVLPVAVAATVRIDSGEPNLEELIAALLNDSLPEAQAAGAQLLAQVIRQQGQKQFKNSSQPIHRKALTAVKALTDEFLNENFIGEPMPVQLTAVWPRNELDLVADMLYEHSGLPLRTIQERVAAWPMSRKLAVLEAYLGDEQPGQVLEKAHYSWDLLGPYAAFRELQRTPAENLSAQPLTPRYGYDIPELIDEADLAETFEKCGDLSLELYSQLQQAGHAQEAQYATLFAHKQRWQMTQNGQQMLLLSRAAPSANHAKILQLMHEKLSDAHPTLGETIS